MRPQLRVGEIPLLARSLPSAITCACPNPSRPSFPHPKFLLGRESPRVHRSFARPERFFFSIQNRWKITSRKLRLSVSAVIRILYLGKDVRSAKRRPSTGPRPLPKPTAVRKCCPSAAHAGQFQCRSVYVSVERMWGKFIVARHPLRECIPPSPIS